MPNFSGVWTLQEQFEAITEGNWTGIQLDELYAWGSGFIGQLGDGTTTTKSSPIQVGSITTWTTASSFGYFSAGISENKLYAWGNNTYGQLGDDTVIRRSSPVQVGSLTNWNVVSAGDSHTVGIKTDGTLWAVGGQNAFGNLGDNTVTRRSSPVQIGAGTNWSQVSVGGNFNGAIKTDGTLWTWGRNNHGQVGDNASTTTNRSSPVQIGALTSWSSVSLGAEHFLAIENGELYAWGRSGFGQVGDNTTVSRSSPVQIGASTDWSIVEAGVDHSLAIKTDGTLWAWGKNTRGQLGQNNTTNLSSPTQIGALTNWANVSGGYGHCCAIKTDGTLWTWGYNTQGALGNNTSVSTSSPIQIGSLTSWAVISAGRNHNLAVSQARTGMS